MRFSIQCNCLTSTTAAADEETRDRDGDSNYQSNDSNGQDPSVMSQDHLPFGLSLFQHHFRVRAQLNACIK